jgi:hypothetical protein
MPNLITDILTDTTVRTPEAVEGLLVSSAEVSSPWSDVAAQ